MVQDSTVDPSKYNQAYSALLHLEEAAETQTLQQYNQQSLKIIHSQGTTFQMKNDVRAFLKFYFSAQKKDYFLNILILLFLDIPFYPIFSNFLLETPHIFYSFIFNEIFHFRQEV